MGQYGTGSSETNISFVLTRANLAMVGLQLPNVSQTVMVEEEIKRKCCELATLQIDGENKDSEAVYIKATMGEGVNSHVTSQV